MSKQTHLLPGQPIDSVDVYSLLLAHLGVADGA
jgi:hypothetical protein